MNFLCPTCANHVSKCACCTNCGRNLDAGLGVNGHEPGCENITEMDFPDYEIRPCNFNGGILKNCTYSVTLSDGGVRYFQNHAATLNWLGAQVEVSV